MRILTLKPTERCNFKCTFCASTHIADNHFDTVKLKEVEETLDRFPELREIHVNGGEPLLMGEDYYLAILKMLEEKKMVNTTLHITSNLWLFYKNPERFLRLVKHPSVIITTSFQYGNGRLKGNLEPFSEKEFIEISDLLKAHAGYRPNFVAVITEENEDTCVQTVELAKRLGVEAKLNHADSSGPHKYFKGVRVGNLGHGYLMGKMYQRLVEIYNLGLENWEDSTYVMARALWSTQCSCPVDRECDKEQRVLQPNGYFSCVSFGDDNVYPINFVREVKERQPIERVNHLLEQPYMHESCTACELFKLCNGCLKTVKSYQEEGLTYAHCFEMTKVKQEIIRINQETQLKEE